MAVALCFGLNFISNAQILYKVEKKGSDKVSYLLGTHHFAPLSVVDSIEDLPGIMKSIDKLYGEIDMMKMTDPALMISMQKALTAPADSTLDKLLPPSQLDSVRNVWNEYVGTMVPFDMMKLMKPAVISSQLAAAMCQKALPDFNPMEGIDITMQNRARELGKEVAGLETMDFQMDMLYGQPLERQAENLMLTIRNAAEEGIKAVELTDAYLNHDISKILDLMIQAEYEDSEMADKMIFSRNSNWVAQLVEELPSKSIMVVVGAGHLPGDKGVIEGLRKAGYAVTPMR